MISFATRWIVGVKNVRLVLQKLLILWTLEDGRIRHILFLSLTLYSICRLSFPEHTVKIPAKVVCSQCSVAAARKRFVSRAVSPALRQDKPISHTRSLEEVLLVWRLQESYNREIMSARCWSRSMAWSEAKQAVATPRWDSSNHKANLTGIALTHE